MSVSIETRRDDVVDDYHGTSVPDPYRWLEDPNSNETGAWAQAQNERTADFMRAIGQRDGIHRRLTELWDYPKHSIPRKHGDRYFYFKNDGLQNQPVLYVQESLRGEPVVLLDPNSLSDEGVVAVTSHSFTDDGRFLAYATSNGGSDWQEARVRNVDTREDTSDLIRWCKFTNVAWTRDGEGFFYNRLPEPGSVPPEDENNYSTVHWHAIGTSQADDRLVYERPDEKELHFTPRVTDDGAYLVITAEIGTDPRTRVYYQALAGDGPPIPLLDDGDAKYWFIDNDGPIFYVLTDLDAPRGRIVAIDTTRPERDNWREIISEPEGRDVITGAHAAGDRFVIVAMRDAQHRLLLHHRDGTCDREIALPAIGTVEALSGKPGDPELFVSFTSFLYPTTPFRCDLSRDDSALEPLHASGIDFDPSGYETRQVFYTSNDGTRVPMFLVHKRGIALDGENPTLLYGYGGFNVALTPTFAVHRLAWLEAGGIFAVANLRGGDEYGEEWHQAGMLHRKQNVFDDFIAAAEWLIESGHTSRQKLAINGGSNGGLLVAACMTQRPELFGAVVCEVPVIDMLRYHRFSVGHFWIPEYGNAEADAEHFRFLHAYSPLHNIRPGVAYPPTLITSADTDDRVVPAHARKFAAALQAAHSGEAPILLRIETKAGHGLGKPTSKVIEERADVYAFLFGMLGIDAY